MNNIRILASFLLLLLALPAQAARQYGGLCSVTKIAINQELALERVGFLATLEVTNNEGDAPITGFSASLTFESNAWSSNGAYEDAWEYFFVQPPILTGVNDINGGGIIPPGQTAKVEWFIIPKIATGGTTPAGVQYRIGANLAAMLDGVEIPATDLAVLPDTITVKPDPQLDITYFQPRDVDGDNPFTLGVVESPIPFTLGVLVRNVGYGPARNVRIASEQPRIVENLQDLLVVPQLIGSRVDDDPTDFTSLTVELGDIEPNNCRKAAWDMITTLSGEFVEFKASYTHAPELGGRDTSVITALNAYFLVHEMRVDTPGRDGMLDFLAQVGEPAPIPGLDADPELIPDTIFETDCNVLPVNALPLVELQSFDGTHAVIEAEATYNDWVFVILPDPGQALMPIKKVTRSDGKVLNSHNSWTHVRYRESDNARLPWLSIVDFVQRGTYTYTVEYEPVGSDVSDPVTTVLFSGEHEQDGDTAWVTPETSILFIVQDQSPVGTWVRVDSDGEFEPAYPFKLEDAGSHTVEYYSQDSRGNVEETRTVTVIVSGTAPSVDDLIADNESLTYTGDAVSLRPEDATISFGATGAGSALGAVVEVFRGAYAAPTLLGVPASPTPSDEASIVIGGENVDLIRYRLNGGAWSAEQPAGTLALSALSGNVTLDVQGRPENGDWLDTNTASATWIVSGSAAPITLVAAQPTPSRDGAASFSVTGVDLYRWTVDGSYFRPEQPITTPFTLPRILPGEHEVDVIGESGGVWQGTASPSRYKHTFDPEWGLRFPAGNLVRTASLGAVGGGLSWTWDGRDDGGAPVTPGWYTVRVSVTDTLGRTSRAVRLVRVGDLLAANALVDAGAANQDYDDAAGRWVVWQDQRHGQWDILAHDTRARQTYRVTDNGRNNERPRTDGFMVVWQGRSADGNWQAWAKELGNAELPFPLSPTPGVDQTRPAVAWPWVVWQEKDTVDPAAKELLVAYDLRDGTVSLVDDSFEDQLDPDVNDGWVVWQDFRDVGFGEIYAKDLYTGAVRRITTSPGGQYHPVVDFPWVVWADNRDVQFELYGYNLRAPGEVQLTDTPENETRPSIQGRWVLYTEDSNGGSSGGLGRNLRALHLDARAVVQLTNDATPKERVRIGDEAMFWIDRSASISQLRAGTLPDLKAVAPNRSLIALTPTMVSAVDDAHELLMRWNAQAGVTELTRFAALAPAVVPETVSWDGSALTGANFALQAGDVLWVRFGAPKVVDLGWTAWGPQTLSAGVNLTGSVELREGHSAWQILRSLGLANVNAIRALDGATGRWLMASVVEGRIQGEDFALGPTDVVFLDMAAEVSGWQP